MHVCTLQVSAGLGPAMVGITDLANDPVNFRDREGGNPDVRNLSNDIFSIYLFYIEHILTY